MTECGSEFRLLFLDDVEMDRGATTMKSWLMSKRKQEAFARGCQARSGGRSIYIRE
jgi:hypothetical protein